MASCQVERKQTLQGRNHAEE